MNGYIEAGYLVVLGTLSSYGVSLSWRERAARRRLGPDPVELAKSPGERSRTDPSAEHDVETGSSEQVAVISSNGATSVPERR